MKNVVISVSQYIPFTLQQQPPPIPPTIKTTNVSFSMQFDDEFEALVFAQYMIANIRNYGK